MKYQRANTVTGGITVESFNGSHDYVFSADALSRQSTRLRIAKELISKWNRQQPLNYEYKLIEVC